MCTVQYVRVLGYICSGFTKHCQYMCLKMCVCVYMSQPQTIQPPVCITPAPFLFTPSTHKMHTHSNRWLILTEIIRQQSHQHGSVVIRVWTQCLFSSRNGRSAWRRRKEMHYSPWCPDPIQRHMLALSFLSFFLLPQLTEDCIITASATFILSSGSHIPAIYSDLQLHHMQTFFSCILLMTEMSA